MNKTEKDEFVQRILTSDLFATKQVLKKLLLYLYEKSEKQECVQEIDIAQDVFHRQGNFDATDDTIVRVNMYKLRKALERFGLDEGKNEKYIAEIPKGSYTLQFISQKEKKDRSHKYKNRYLLPFIIIIFLLLLSNIFFIARFFGPNTGKNMIWSDYIREDKPVCITLGDPFFFRAKNDSTNENYIVRDINVNTSTDLDTMKLEFLRADGFELSPLEYSYFSQNNLWPLLDIIKVFVKTDKELRLAPLSSITADDMKSYNHIVIGNINSFGAFTNYLSKSSIRIKTNPRRIIIHQGNSDSLVFHIDETVKGYYVDHAFLVKVPGPDNNIISLIGDFHASGNKGLSHLITEKSMLKELEAKIESEYGEFPDFFEMVVEVSSYNYEDFETKLIFFNKIEE